MIAAPPLRRYADLAFLGVVLLTVAHFAFAHEGLYALDDYYYSRYAHQLLTGTFRLGPDPQGLLHDPLHERWLIFGPVAVCYALFGINIISTTLWPLLATLGCSGLLWGRYRRTEPLVAAGAMLLLGLFYFVLNLSIYLYPDNINMLACLAAATALNVGRRKPNPAAWGAAFAGLNFAALLCKETIVYYAPFYLALLTADVLRRRHLRFWMGVAVAGAGLLGAYLLFYHYQTGDALYRIHLIEHTNEFLKEGNYLLGNRAALWARITTQPLQFMLATGLGLNLLLAVGSAFVPRPAAQPDHDRYFWLALAGSTLLGFWLGSTSLTRYNPISLQPRMITPLLPPLALAAGFGLRDVLLRQRSALPYALLLLALTGYLALEHNTVAVLYGGWALVMLALWLPGRWPGFGAARTAAVGLAGVAAVLALRPVHFMRKPSVSGHFAQNRIIRQHLQALQQGVVLLDDYLITNYDFYYGYQVPAGLRFRRYWSRDSLAGTPAAYLLLNRATLTNPELTRKLLRYSADSVLSWYPQRQLLAQDGPVELYQVRLPKSQ